MPGKTPPHRKPAPKPTPTAKPTQQGAGVKATATFPKKSTPFGPYRKA